MLLASLVLAAPACALAAQARGAPDPPPGTVRIEGGRTRVGSTTRAVEELGAKNEAVFPSLVCETPEHEVQLDDFFLMTTEVTNEQYERYVRSTGARPPQHWGEPAIQAARRAHEDELERATARAAHRGEPAPDAAPFDASRWWREHWRAAQWEVSRERASRPVVYVSHRDAEAYARWAGLRLMSELEYQRAARGRAGAVFPWGDAWDERRAVTRANGASEPLPVGSLSGGASPQGVHDLAGNCWEWTSSPFTAFPGYRDLQLVVGFGQDQRKVNGLTRWDPAQRVSVGGCFQTGLLVARATTRRPTDPEQATDSLGFRCAKSVARGVDLARAILRDEFPPERRARELRFEERDLALADRWSSTKGSANCAGYALITAYDHLLFVPAKDIDATTVKALRERARERPVALGILSTTRAVLEPALAPGVYLLRLSCGPGANAEPRADRLLFERPDGTLAAESAAPELEYVHPADARIEPSPGPGGAGTRVALSLRAWARVPAKAFAFTLELELGPDEITPDWTR